MAIRNLRLEGDPILRKKSREVKEVTPKIRELIDDMLETMYDKDGVGLAAPQVGILRRIVVIDVGDGPLVMVNPQIIREEGSQTGDEGCLSVPGKSCDVKRPNQSHRILIKIDNGNDMSVTAEGFIARSLFRHEIDHLDGTLYYDKKYDGKE